MKQTKAKAKEVYPTWVQGIDANGLQVGSGHSNPSKSVIQWFKHGRFSEFPAFKTSPQQDVKADGSGIKIHKVTDKRAQPWMELVRANIHKNTAKSLPAETATVKEVREWIYLVLTQKKKIGTLAGEKPQIITSSVAYSKIDGKKLREMTPDEWTAFCPSHYLNVYQEKRTNEIDDRAMVSMLMEKTTSKLLKAETKMKAKEAPKMQPAKKWHLYFGAKKEAEALGEKVKSCRDYIALRYTLTQCLGDPANALVQANVLLRDRCR